MTPETYTFRIPQNLRAVMAKRAKQLGYPNLGAYLTSLAQYDLAIGKDHAITGDFWKLPPEERDRINAKIIEAYNSGKSLGGSWFENSVRKAVQDIAQDKDIPKSRLKRELLKKITE